MSFSLKIQTVKFQLFSENFTRKESHTMTDKIKTDDAVIFISEAIRELLQYKEHVIIAIDGRCGAGKTTLAKALGEKLLCDVIHMDDFFLRPEQRTSKRLSVPGENIDHERFLCEVLMPLSRGEHFIYRPFDCQTGTFKEAVSVTPGKITVIEGSYSCHPKLSEYYDLCIFADTDPQTQLSRIRERNGNAAAERFKNIWIPLEEKYFSAYDIKKYCDLKFMF